MTRNSTDQSAFHRSQLSFETASDGWEARGLPHCCAPTRKYTLINFSPCSAGKRARSNTTIKNTHQNGSQHSNGRLVSGACMTMNKRRLFSDFSISLWRIGRLCELTVMFLSLSRQLRDFSAHAEGEKCWINSSTHPRNCFKCAPSYLRCWACLHSCWMSYECVGGWGKSGGGACELDDGAADLFWHETAADCVWIVCVGECGRILTVVDSNFSVALKTIFHSLLKKRKNRWNLGKNKLSLCEAILNLFSPDLFHDFQASCGRKWR